MRTRTRAAITVAAALLGACTGIKDHVIFVTATEIGIGADATVGTFNLGYDRNELFVGPQYVETGATPPVAAAIVSDLGIFSPDITQVYATGDAAVIATTEDKSKLTEAELKKAGVTDLDTVLCGARRTLFFGTSANIGLKMAFTAGQTPAAPTQMNLGYKRREVSIVPMKAAKGRLAWDTNTASECQDNSPAVPANRDFYASLLAAIGINIHDDFIGGGKIELDQFFATGRAAKNLARNVKVREAFGLLAENAAKKVNEALEKAKK